MTPDEVVTKLQRHFGLGDKPTLRLALYERVARLIEEEGEECLHVVATVVEDAMRARTDKGRYFANVVLRRLRDRGFLPKVEF